MHLAGVMLLVAVWVAGAGCGSKQEQTSAPELKRQAIDRQTAAYLFNAQEALRQDAFTAALIFTDSAAQRTPDLADVYFLRGRIYTELNRPERAEEAYKKVLSLDQRFRGAAFNLGNTAFRRQQYRDALEYYKQEQEAFPASKVLVALGRAYTRLGVVDSARQAFLQALEADTASHAAHARLSQLYEDDGMIEEALAHAHRALALQPDNIHYRYIAGSLMLQAGQVHEAVEAFEAVAAQDRWHHGAHYNLGNALVRLGREEEALRHMAWADSVEVLHSEVENLRALAKMTPRQARPWLNLSDALRRVGRMEEAAEAYQMAVYLHPTNLQLHTNLATLFLQAGDTTRAIRRYETVLQQDPAFADAWLNLGVAHASAGNYEAAQQAWENVLKHQPQHAQARAYLTRLGAQH